MITITQRALDFLICLTFFGGLVIGIICAKF